MATIQGCKIIALGTFYECLGDYSTCQACEYRYKIKKK